MSITPGDIHSQEFRESFRGYNEDDVDTFLDQVAEEYSRLFQETQRMRIQISSTQQELSRQRESADDQVRGAHDLARGQARTETREEIRRALVAAQKAADTALAEARSKAREILAEAERRARDMDERTMARARELDPDMALTIETLRDRVEELQRLEAETRTRIRTMLEEQIRIVDQFEAAELRGDLVDRMAAELNDDAEGNPQRFWKKPRV